MIINWRGPPSEELKSLFLYRPSQKFAIIINNHIHVIQDFYTDANQAISQIKI